MGPVQESRVERSAVGDFAAALAALLKATAVYPRAHPRVQAAAVAFLAHLPHNEDPGRWLPLRVRGQDIGIGDSWLRIESPVLAWMAERLREAGLCGIEFGAGCTIEDVLDFAEVLGRCRSRQGPAFASLWQADHPRLRPLDLVFHGDHVAGAQRTDEVVAPTEAEARRGELLHRLEDCDAVVQRMLTIEAGCRKASDHEVSEEVDLLAAIVDLLPVEIVSDPERVTEVVLEVLDRLHARLIEELRRNGRIDDAELTRMALAVARRYFESRGPGQPLRRDLPAGRPEDEAIGPDLNALLLDMAALPDATGLRMPPAASFERTGSAMSTELLGIQLHLLVHTRRAESLAVLRQALAPLASGMTAEQEALLDIYLRPAEDGGPAVVGDVATLALLGFFERLGMGARLLRSGYLTPGLLARTFPASLPLAARVLGADPAGTDLLRQGVAALEPKQRAAGIQVAAQQGILLDPAVVRALIRAGSDAVLPLLEPAAGSDTPELKEMIVAFVRTLGLPEAEAAVLRCLEPVTLLPGSYLQELLRLLLQKKPPDARLRLFSGQLLRGYVDRGLDSLPLPRLLGAIDSLRHLPGNESTVFLRRLASEGRFTSLGQRARAIRRQASETLARIAGRGAKP